MAQAILELGGGGGVQSDDVTATAKDVRKGKTYVGSDTGDDVGTGSLEEIYSTRFAPLKTEERLVVPKDRITLGDIYVRQIYSTNFSEQYIRAGSTIDVYTLNDDKITHNNLYSVKGTFGADKTATAADVRQGKTLIGKDGAELTGTLPVITGGKWPAQTTDREIYAGENIIVGPITIGGISQTNLIANNIVNNKTVTVYTKGASGAIHNLYSVTGTLGSEANVTNSSNSIGGTTSSHVTSGVKVLGSDCNLISGTLAMQDGKNYTPTATSQTVIVAPKRLSSKNLIINGDTNLKAENIKHGVSIFGIAGSYVGGTLVGKGATLYIIKDGKFQTGWTGSYNYGNGAATTTSYGGKNAIKLQAYHRYVYSGIDDSSYPAYVGPVNGANANITLSTGSVSTFSQAGIVPQIYINWSWSTFSNMDYENVYCTSSSYGISSADVQTDSTISNRAVMPGVASSGTYTLDSCNMLSTADLAKYNRLKISGFSIQPSADEKTCNLVFYVNEMYIKLT